jgi:hypothetical protein
VTRVKQTPIDKLNPLFCTIVTPEEYNIQEDMERAVEIANMRKTAYVSIDIGKIIGLYKQWLVLLNEKKEGKNEKV